MRDRFEEMAERVQLDLELYGVRQSIDGRRRVIAEALRAAYERGAGEGRAKGREDVGKYSNAIGLIESAIGYAGARPLRETVAAVQRLVAEREGALREVAALRDELASIYKHHADEAYEQGRRDALRGVQAAALYRHAELWHGRMRLTSADERRDIDACELAWAAAKAAEEASR